MQERRPFGRRSILCAMKNNSAPRLRCAIHLLSGFLLEHRAAVAAGDGDFAFAAGDAEDLLAAGALEIDVLPILGLVALALEPVHGRAGKLQKCLVFRPAPVIVPAEGTEEDNKSENRGYQLEDRDSNLHADKKLYHPKKQEKNAQKYV